MSRIIKVLIAVVVLAILAGCAPGAPDNDQKSDNYQNMTAEELKTRMDNNEEFFLVDVHIPEQRHIKGTDAFVPFDRVAESAAEFPADKNETIIVYCRSGNMSVDASRDLIGMGYKNVFNVLGGTNAWSAAGYPFE